MQIKKIMLDYLLIILLSFVSITSSAQKKSGASSAPGIRGVANLIISEETGRKYVSTFKQQFRKTVSDFYTLQESFEIDYCFIEKFTNVLETSSNNYNGFKFVFGSDKNESNKEKLFLVPTTALTDTTKKDIWNTPTNVESCSFRNFKSIGSTKAKSMKEEFGRFSRMENTAGFRDNLSKSVWMDKMVMQFIRDTIRNHPSSDTISLIGINVFNACYDTKVFGSDVIGQEYDIQSTVVIVFKALNKKSGDIFDYWQFTASLFQEITDKKNERMKIVKTDAINHGELCPTKCN